MIVIAGQRNPMILFYWTYISGLSLRLRYNRLRCSLRPPCGIGLHHSDVFVCLGAVSSHDNLLVLGLYPVLQSPSAVRASYSRLVSCVGLPSPGRTPSSAAQPNAQVRLAALILVAVPPRPPEHCGTVCQSGLSSG